MASGETPYIQTPCVHRLLKPGKAVIESQTLSPRHRAVVQAAAVNYVPAAPDGSDGFAVSEEEMIQIWQPRASWRSKHDQ